MNKPTKSRLRSASNYLDNAKRDVASSEEEKRRKIDELISGQDYIDNWNTKCVGSKGMNDNDLIEHFNNIQLDGSSIIIQMYMENPIKSLIINDSNNEIVSVDYGVQQIDYRTRNTDVAKWGPSPFPVIDKGVIMAISPQVKMWYYETKEKLSKYDKAAADSFIIPEVGDIVYTNHFLFKEHRYYPDKQKKCEDFVKSQEELRLNNFDFLFKITNYEIESIVKRERKDLLLDNTKDIRSRATHITIENPQDNQDNNSIIESE